MRRKHPLLTLAAALLAALSLSLAACGGEATKDPIPTPDEPKTPDPTDETQMARSKLTRNVSPAVPAADQQALVAGNNGFALDLYHQLGQGAPADNLFFSPLSISMALAMVHAGAGGQTERQMASTLGFTLDQSRLHPAFNGLDLALASRGQGAQGKDGKGFRLNLVNAVWGQRGYPFQAPYLDTLAVDYGAGLRLMNFKDQPDPSRVTINKWVEQQTESRIKDLIPPGQIDGYTRLVLTNAIYFNAAWLNVFDKANTVDREFTRLDGTKVAAPTMSMLETWRHAAGADWQAVELPYDGGELSMLVIVPEAGSFATVEARLDAAFVKSVADAMAPKQMTLRLPKWKTESKALLKETLRAMGMTDAFSVALADFKAINGGVEELYIGQVIHQAFVEVDEAGTEAAAATAVVMAGGAMPPPDRLEVDRPFVFVIRDIPSGSILFVGRVTDPTR